VTLDEDLQLALSLADWADAITMGAFKRSDLVIDTKPDMTPVTEADRHVELVLRKELSTERPGDGVVGEEFGAEGGTERRWIIDPIDGTKNFVRGVPVWATLIALEGQVGVVSAPALQRRWWAARDRGAYLNGDPIRVSKVSTLADAEVSAGGMDGWDQWGGPAAYIKLVDACWRDRGFGDFWSHMLVAEGGCDIGLDPIVSVWDLAPLQVIVEEAGGIFTDFEGVAGIDRGSAISSNGLVHEAALEILREAR
jgi:histidinol-phosphatase